MTDLLSDTLMTPGACDVAGDGTNTPRSLSGAPEADGAPQGREREDRESAPRDAREAQ